MTLQASKDENSSWKLFLMLFHSCENQVNCLSPGRSHMQIHHSVKLNQSWFSEHQRFLSFLSPACFLLSMLTAYGTQNSLNHDRIFSDRQWPLFSFDLNWNHTSPKDTFVFRPCNSLLKYCLRNYSKEGWLVAHNKGGSPNAICEWARRYTRLLDEFWQALR